MSAAIPRCGTPSQEHLMEECSCADQDCINTICVWCGLILIDGRYRA